MWLPEAASLMSFLVFTGHPLAVPEHDHVHDRGRGQYNLKCSKANLWNFQGITVTGVPKVTPVNTPCSRGDCCSSLSCGLLRATHLSKEEGWRDTVKWHFSTGLLFSGAACELKSFWRGKNGSTPKPYTLYLRSGLLLGPGGTALLCLFWSELTAPAVSRHTFMDL